jgi:RND family efflux transporter MFP subunit
VKFAKDVLEASDMRRRIQLAGLAVATAIALLLMLHLGQPPVLAHSDDDTEATDGELDGPRSVSPETAKFIGLKTAECTVRLIGDSVQLSGRVGVAPEGRRTVCSRFAGRVVSIQKQIGDSVKADEIVASIESPEVVRNQLDAFRSEAEHQRLLLEIEKTKVEAESLKRTARVSELQHEAAKKELERLKTQPSTSPLAALEMANREESVTRTAGDLRILKMQLDLSEGTVANLTKQDNAVLAALKIQQALGSVENGVLKITAERAGTITALPVTSGEWVQTGQTLFEIADLTTVQIEADVPESLIQLVKNRKTDKALIRGGWAKPIEGKTRTLGSVIHPVRRTATLYVNVPNADNSLLDGGRVSIVVSVTDAREVPAIPRSAVISRGPRRIVFIKSGALFEQQDVATGNSDGEFVEIKSGLAPGDTVVVEGAQALLHLRPVARTSQK